MERLALDESSMGAKTLSGRSSEWRWNAGGMKMSHSESELVSVWVKSTRVFKLFANPRDHVQKRAKDTQSQDTQTAGRTKECKQYAGLEYVKVLESAIVSYLPRFWVILFAQTMFAAGLNDITWLKDHWQIKSSLYISRVILHTNEHAVNSAGTFVSIRYDS